MKFDDTMRARLKTLADQERLPELDGRVRARLERNAVSQLKRTEARSSWAFGFVALGALAVAGLLVLQLPSSEVDPRIVNTPPLRVEPPAKPVVSTESAGLGCAEHRGSAWHAGENGQQELDLGARALLVATGQARIAHALSESCDVWADLTDGSVAVHARNLRGGRLVVGTSRGDVTVKGTIFEVTFDAERKRMRVAVDEGRVEVVTKEGDRFDVGPGVSLALGTDVVREVLTGAARDALRRRLHLPGVDVRTRARERHEAAVPEVDAGEEARAWRSGSVEKPRLAPEPGTSVTEEGRPMLKPRIVDGESVKEGDKP